MPFDPETDRHKEFCVVCLEDFSKGAKISWLPCDRRHYFHHECIMFWLVKHPQCPLCKKEVNFEAAAEMKRETN